MKIVQDLWSLIGDFGEQLVEWVMAYPLVAVLLLVLLIAWAVRGYRTL